MIDLLFPDFQKCIKKTNRGFGSDLAVSFQPPPRPHEVMITETSSEGSE